MHRHVEVYLDESGDLGFSKGSSRHFIVAALVVDGDVNIARIVNKCHRRFGSSLSGNPELKFNRSPDRVRKFILSAVSATGAGIAWSGIRKSNLGESRMIDREAVWRMVAARTVSGASSRISTKSMHIVVDRRSIRKVAMESLDSSIQVAVKRHYMGQFEPELRISHVSSASFPGLQLVDNIAGAVFQRLERGKERYMELIENNITSVSLESW